MFSVFRDFFHLVIFSTFPSNIRSRPLFPSFGIFLVFPGLVWWSQTAWFLAEPFPRIPASLCSETTCQPPPSWNSRPELQAPPFKSKTYFSTAPIIVAACTGPIRVSTCRGEGQKKLHKNGVSCYSLDVLCISGKWWRRPTVQALVTFPFKRLLRSVEGIWTDKVYKEININVTKIETLKISKRSHISIDTTRYVGWGILPGKKPQSGLASALLWTKTHFCYLNKLFFTHVNIACLSKRTSYKKEEFDLPSGLEDLIFMYQQSTSSAHLPYIYLLVAFDTKKKEREICFVFLSMARWGGALTTLATWRCRYRDEE